MSASKDLWERKSKVDSTGKEDTKMNAIEINIEAPKKAGQSKSFYLSDDNIKKLGKTARRKQVSESKLINEILQQVLDNIV